MVAMLMGAIGMLLLGWHANAAAQGTEPGSGVSADSPRVPFQYGLGMQKFQAKCAECHGTWAQGTDKGPTLLHPFYKPSHHGDQSFYRAALQGVQAHHWGFGDMPPVEGIIRKDMDAIIPFLRWWQKENGIR